MREWRTRLQAAPLYVLFLYFTVGFGGLGYLLDPVSGHSRSWIAHLIGGIFFGLTMTAVIAWQRRRSGGAQKQLVLVRALKKGELPPDADPAEWAPVLERKKRTYRRLQPLGALEFTAFTALAVWLASSQGAVWWIFAGFFFAAGVVVVVSSRRYVGRIERMQRQLGTGSASDPIGS